MSLQNSPPAMGGVYQKQQMTAHYTIRNFSVNPYVSHPEKCRSESGAIERAGGAAYIQSVFQGIGDGNE
jgi:hypothetical protein